MGLFRLMNRKAKNAPPQQVFSRRSELLWRKSFRQSGSFKGYRRVRLTIYKEDGVDETLRRFASSGCDFTGCSIRLDHVHVYGRSSDYKYVDVYVDDMRIGCIYSSNAKFYPLLTEYDYDKAFIKVEDDSVYLFIRYTETPPDKSNVY